MPRYAVHSQIGLLRRVVMMWKSFLLGYLMLGSLIIFTTKARRQVFCLISPADIERSPAWKIVALYCLTVPVAFACWPVFLPGWLRKEETLWDALNRPEGNGGSGLKEIFDAMNSLSEDGCDTDEIPGAEGRFGWDVSNPIPTHTTFGSTSYLGRLRTQRGETVSYERIGSFTSPASPMPVDGYEIRDPGGTDLGVIYISPYHRRNSQKAPEGLLTFD
jgi:hypothetical protein